MEAEEEALLPGSVRCSLEEQAAPRDRWQHGGLEARRFKGEASSERSLCRV